MLKRNFNGIKHLAKRATKSAPIILAVIIFFSCMLTAYNVYTEPEEILVARNPVSVVIKQGNLEMSVLSEDETVLSLLTRAGIKLDSGDDISPSLLTRTYDGLEISITRTNATQIVKEETLEYDSERIPSLYMEKGAEVLITPGQNGKKLTTYEVFVQNGIEIYRYPVSETVLVPAVNEVIEYGSGGTIISPDGAELNYSHIIDVTATAYSTEGWRNKRTALGTTARVGAIAVDPKVIPLRTRVYVESHDGSWIYGESVCEDTGGAIKGNIIDLFFNTQRECFQFGRRPARVYILE